MDADPSNPRAKVRLWAYDLEAPSFRHRLLWAVPELERLGFDVLCETLPRGRYLLRLLARRAALRSTDLLVLSKIKVSVFEKAFLQRWARSIAFDFDDAIYFRKPRRLGEDPDRSKWRLSKFAATCRMADLVIAGNQVLAERAQGCGSRVVIVPTPVNARDYRPLPPSERDGSTLVWIGLPENLVYLQLVRPALAQLAREHDGLRLRIVSSAFPDWSDVPIERVEWSTESEGVALASAGVGLMPLSDDDWTRGKCAFKLLQYMAAGLPCVASAVGANRDAVVDGETGFLVGSHSQWIEALRALLNNGALRDSMGAAGRQRLLKLYDREIVVPPLVTALTSLLKRDGRRDALPE